MPVRSPLTAAARQRSRRPARHVVCPIDIFPPTAFLQFYKSCFGNWGQIIGIRYQFPTKKSMKAEQAGAFFSSESGEKKRTGRVGLCVSLKNYRNANTNGWGGQCVS